MEFRSMGSGDIDAVIEILKSDANLAFQPWEISALRRHVSGQNPHLLSRIAVLENQVIGVLFFGCSGKRASLNHLWVDENHRKTNCARDLLNVALSDCPGSTVHLMTVCGNRKANTFFSSQGFQRGGVFYELDLEEGTDAKCNSEGVGEYLHILGLRGLMYRVPNESEWDTIRNAYVSATGIRRIHFIPPPNFRDQDILHLGFKIPEGETLWTKQV